MTTREPGVKVTDPQGAHIGHLLRDRRTMFGVELIDVLRANPGTDAETIRFAERAGTPSSLIIGYWYSRVRTALDQVPAWKLRGYAERNQWYTTPADTTLFHRAAELRPRVVWWWGINRATAPRGAWCYVCDQLIHGYDVSTTMSRKARLEIMNHRARHVTELVVAPAANPKRGQK